MTLFDNEKSFQLAVKDAKSQYTCYLRTFGLRSVELRACNTLANTSDEPSEKASNDTVRLRRRLTSNYTSH